MKLIIDKSKWPGGIWKSEPDLVSYKTAEGYHAVIIRHKNLGHLCGYVGVPKTHAAYGKHYSSLEEINVHGDLTYAGLGKMDFLEDPEAWYLGFDCNHLGDYAPGIHEYSSGGNYRCVEHVKREIEGLSEQLAKVAA